MALPTITGTARLYADPELKFGQTGTAVARIPLVFNARRKNSAGEWEDADSCFLTGALFGQQAEAAAEQLAKGTEVEIRGRLRTRTWEQDGQRRSTTELIIDSIAPTLRNQARRADRSAGQPDNDPWAANPPF